MSARRATVALAAIGLAIAAYLTVVHYAGFAPVCAVSGGCEKVQASSYAKLAGVPIAVLGVIGYLAILGLSLVRDTEDTRLAAAATALGGVGFSAYLTYRELFTIHAICQWCAASAVIMAALAVLTTRRFLYPPVSDRYSSLAETPVRSETTDAATRGLAPASTSAETARPAASR